jgi:hypothetical protein
MNAEILESFANACECLQMSANVCKCLRTLANACERLRMPANAASFCAVTNGQNSRYTGNKEEVPNKRRADFLYEN